MLKFTMAMPATLLPAPSKILNCQMTPAKFLKTLSLQEYPQYPGSAYVRIQAACVQVERGYVCFQGLAGLV